ncbi:hypothetical protein Apa02nite_062430 [Actinoplanes palleronii]|uniref:Uncharacterized protein n=1 Tax=Actinoplanes palleronii TaxID=113570 RepID=A0ABQ4BIN5_9ACTN|nr:hypothetical protein Apa02nite_062430 [Actinoplanes palleronii]
MAWAGAGGGHHERETTVRASRGRFGVEVEVVEPDPGLPAFTDVVLLGDHVPPGRLPGRAERHAGRRAAPLTRNPETRARGERRSPGQAALVSAGR